jgi:DNA-binding beta-propeller fold protein YncE
MNHLTTDHTDITDKTIPSIGAHLLPIRAIRVIRGSPVPWLLLLLLVPAALSVVPARADEPTALYQLADPLPVGGTGGFDYINIDATGQTLYVTRSSHTMVLAAATGKLMADIPDNNHSHGVALAPDAGRGFISNGGGAGSVTIFDLKTNAVLANVKAAPDADAIIYDPASHLVFAGCGDAGVVVSIPADVDPHSGGGGAKSAIALGGKPEYLVADGQGKVFIAIQDKDEIVALDTTTLKIIARYPTAPGSKPTGMSMDRAQHRLFVGCRNKKMIVMSAEDGHILADLPIGDRVDATAFDRGCALASCGDGTITVIRETTPGQYAVVQTVKTIPGARTMTVDPQTGTLYLPVSVQKAFEVVVVKRVP